MTAARRDWLSVGAALGLLVLGVIGWWRLPLVPGVTGYAELPVLALFLAAAGVTAAAAWLVNHPIGSLWSALVATLALAATAPLSVVPLVMSLSAGTMARVGLTLAAIAVLPFALCLTGWIASPHTARAARRVSVGCVAIAVVGIVAIGPFRFDGYLGVDVHLVDPWAARLLLLAAAVLIPCVAAALSVLGDADVPLTTHARIITATVLATSSVLPVIASVALLSPSLWPVLIAPVVVALGTVAILARVAIGPLARDAGVASTQRDLVIIASESERSRLAASLHDGPLADVALLVQRLDASGDTDNAALARTIADELRDVGNGLRLPVVEDLGVGAGLEWLVERLGRTAGAPIELVVAEDGRPRAEVEGALYRIAQEALMNAIRHGAPPVEVRYEARPDAVHLTVTDHGGGIEPDAPDRAVRAGRLGLLMMRHRADAIGASLVVAPRPEGGTLVELDWPRAGA
jgi:signal transduction histidine kinase